MRTITVLLSLLSFGTAGLLVFGLSVVFFAEICAAPSVDLFSPVHVQAPAFYVHALFLQMNFLFLLSPMLHEIPLHWHNVLPGQTHML